jgi:hypothetical protein
MNLAASNYLLTDIKDKKIKAVARKSDRYSLTIRYVPLAEENDCDKK